VGCIAGKFLTPPYYRATRCSKKRSVFQKRKVFEGNKASKKKFCGIGTSVGIRLFADGWARSEFGLALARKLRLSFSSEGQGPGSTATSWGHRPSRVLRIHPLWWGLAMTLINSRIGSENATNTASSDPVHDFAWHRQHRSRRSVRLVDIAMVAAWAAFVGWMLFHH
jgi:hypothetical protein